MTNVSRHITQRSWGKRFLAQRRVKWILGYLLSLGILAAIAPLISSDLPFSCTYQGESFQPFYNPDQLVSIPQNSGGVLDVAASQIDWHSLELEDAAWSLIPYREKARINHRELSPFGPQILRDGTRLTGRARHWLGTDQAGRDILGLLLHGIHISLGVGILGTLLAGLIGFLIGSLAGYFGDDRLRVPSFVRWAALPILLAGLWMGFWRKSILLEQLDGRTWWAEFFTGLLVMGITMAFLWLMIRFIWRRTSAKTRLLKLDFLISRMIEILDSLPQLLLIISLGAILSRDLWTFLLLIGLTSWSGVARLVRAETLRIRDADYITAARISRIPNRRIIWRHIWPQVIPMLLIPLAFGVGNIIIAESSLSFLGIIEDSQSWGSILSEAVHVRRLWWLPVFPGLAIFCTVLCINILGESLRKSLSVIE